MRATTAFAPWTPRVDNVAREWLAVQVRVGREHSSAKHLDARGYETFLPCHSELRRWSDRLKKLELPLFPGYVFCRTESDVAGGIVTTPGVIRIVSNKSGPLAIAGEEIEAIRRLIEARVTAEACAFVRAGQHVRICAGPLEGVEGLVVKTTNGHRLVLSVSLLQRAVAVEIDSACVATEHDRRRFD